MSNVVLPINFLENARELIKAVTQTRFFALNATKFPIRGEKFPKLTGRVRVIGELEHIDMSRIAKGESCREITSILTHVFILFSIFTDLSH
jgi:hypothetical protein